MFGSFRGKLKLVEASHVIQDALRATCAFNEELDTKDLSSKLVANLYCTKPELFDGKMGPRPHVVATAASALAQGLTHRPQGFSENADLRMFSALGKLLTSASAHSDQYKFGGYDVPMLKIAEQAFWKHEERTRDATDKVLGSFGL